MLKICVCSYEPCSQFFTPTKGSLGLFCSSKCYKLTLPQKITYACAHCAEPFSRAPSYARHGGHPKTCSWACRRALLCVDIKTRILRKITRCQHGDICLYCCWPWNGRLTLGYGRISDKGKVFIASRAVWEIWNNQSMPMGFDAAHYCNFSACCNFLHIYKATRQQNVDDAIRAGTHIQGSRAGASKLVEKDIPIIFALRMQGLTYEAIAAIFHVTKEPIRKVLLREAWTHVPISPDLVEQARLKVRRSRLLQ